MQDNDWEHAAGHLTENCVIDRPCEYWPMPYEPRPGRHHLTRAIAQIP